MGKGWKNPGKIAAAQKKGLIFTKLAREIQVSAKLGGPDPEGNSRLKLAIAAAKEASCPKDTIERAIKKGSGQLEGAQYEDTYYEGYGPHKVGVIVHCMTDNKTRTVSDIRQVFNKNGGILGELGSVAWMFSKVSLIEGKISKNIDPEEEAIEVGANEVESDDQSLFSFYGAPEDLDLIRNALVSRGWEIITAELSMVPSQITDINEEQLAEVNKLLEALDDFDDSHRVYASIKF